MAMLCEQAAKSTPLLAVYLGCLEIIVPFYMRPLGHGTTTRS